MNDRLSLTPGIRYRFLSQEVEFESTNESVDLSYFALDIGVAWAF